MSHNYHGFHFQVVLLSHFGPCDFHVAEFALFDCRSLFRSQFLPARLAQRLQMAAEDYTGNVAQRWPLAGLGLDDSDDLLKLGYVVGSQGNLATLGCAFQRWSATR